jgi:hypothetical protein
MSNVFLSGEKINLCIPEDGDFEQWASWFNDQIITRYLEQGKFPNTISQQREFYQREAESGRFLTLIKTKDNKLLGVISLSEFRMDRRDCQVAYVCPDKSSKALLAPLEALAMCTQHAFLRLGMERVWAGHAYPGLLNWIRKTEIIGYKADGVFPSAFRHGLFTSDSVKTSITKDRFLNLFARRGNNLWPGEEIAGKILSELKQQTSLAEKIDQSIKALHHDHDALLLTIEGNLDK